MEGLLRRLGCLVVATVCFFSPYSAAVCLLSHSIAPEIFIKVSLETLPQREALETQRLPFILVYPRETPAFQVRYQGAPV